MNLLSIEERVNAAIALGELSQGGFLEHELAEMLKDEEVSKAFYEHIDECSGCGRIWPIDSMEDSKAIDGLVCHYCVDDEENEDED